MTVAGLPNLSSNVQEPAGASYGRRLSGSVCVDISSVRHAQNSLLSRSLWGAEELVAEQPDISAEGDDDEDAEDDCDVMDMVFHLGAICFIYRRRVDEGCFSEKLLHCW